MQRVLEFLRRRFTLRRPQRNEHSRYHTGQSGVHSRFENRDPKKEGHYEIRGWSDDVQSVKNEQANHEQARDDERIDEQLLGIEQRNNNYSAQVVKDGDAQEQGLQRRWHSLSQQRQHAQGERNISCRGNRPPAHRHWVMTIQSYVNQGRSDHAAGGRKRRQAGASQSRKVTFKKFALEFQPDDKEEEDHQPVIDPMDAAFAD